MLTNNKILIIVNKYNDCGYLKIAKYKSKYSNAEIAVFPFLFDACLMPTNFDYKTLKKCAGINYITNTLFDNSSLKKFYKIDFSLYDRIILCHGNKTNDLMLLMFFAKYFNKPFYELDISNYKNNDGLAFFENLDYDFIKSLFGKETLVSDNQIKKLQNDWDILKEKDTGFHSINKDGFVENTNLEDLWMEISNFLNDNTLSLARLIGEMMSRHIFNTEEYILKVIIYFFLNGKLQAFQANGKKIIEITTKDINKINYKTLFKKAND